MSEAVNQNTPMMTSRRTTKESEVSSFFTKHQNCPNHCNNAAGTKVKRTSQGITSNEQITSLIRLEAA